MDDVFIISGLTAHLPGSNPQMGYWAYTWTAYRIYILGNGALHGEDSIGTMNEVDRDEI